MTKVSLRRETHNYVIAWARNCIMM